MLLPVMATKTPVGPEASHVGLRVTGDFLSKPQLVVQSTASRCTSTSEPAMCFAGETAPFQSNAALLLELGWDNYPQVINQP